MAQAKAALIGYAATYRDTHSGEPFGLLPCPDTDNDGVAEASCGSADVSVIGRLPWKTLGLPPLRDAAGECLWYAVSGRAKYNPKTTGDFNWDSLGQFIVQDKAGNTLAGATEHDRPMALLFSAGPPLSGQSRTTVGTTDCGGNSTLANYLEDTGTLGTGDTTVALATTDSIRTGTNNDAAIWIGTREIFDVVKKRSDFKSSVDTLLNDILTCLNAMPQATLASATLDPAGSKGIDNLVGFVTNAANNCTPYATATSSKRKFLDNWKSNLLYARMAAADVTNAGRSFGTGGQTGCKAVIVFGGERTGSQQRHDATTAGTHGNYLESMAANFPSNHLVPDGASLGGASTYSTTSPATDVAACIRGLPAGATQVSFSGNFGDFAVAGSSGAAAPDSANATADLLDASGSSGGCFWYTGTPIPLAGKTMRSYYRFRFAFGDDPAAAPDLRYGFTLQLVKSDMGYPDQCGTAANSGVLSGSNIYGNRSFIIESDIYQSSSHSDPVANHTAIMKNGSLNHAGYGVTTSTACDGSANLCEHAPVNFFEETPTPQAHNQRMEIVTGCNSSCSACDPNNHVTPNTYAKVAVWVDCTACADVSMNLDRIAQPPKVQICSDLDVSMDSIYFGFTGGFSPIYPNAVTISDFVLRSE
jgi:hypothetical protein